MKTLVRMPFVVLSLSVLTVGFLFAQDPPAEEEKPSALSLSLALGAESCVVGDDLQMEVVLTNNGESVEVTDLMLEERSLTFHITLDDEGERLSYDWTVTAGDPHLATRLALPRVTLAGGGTLKRLLRVPVILAGKAKIRAIFNGSGNVIRSEEIAFDVSPSENGNNLGLIIDVGEDRTMLVNLMPRNAPRCLTHFIRLVRLGFYDNMPVHQIIPANWFQAGCPYGLGTGGPGFAVRSEAAEQPQKEFTRGTLALSGYDKLGFVGSQFFLTTGKVGTVDGKYPIIGRIDPKNEKSLKTLETIDKTETDPEDNKPMTEITIRSCKVMVVE